MLSELDELVNRIQNLRSYMHYLIEQKENLLDMEIVGVSKMLDKLLLEYEKLIISDKTKKPSDKNK